MRRTATLLLAGCLALAGCSSSGGSEPAPTASVSKTPTVSTEQAAAACVEAWHGVMTADGYDPDSEPPKPAACEGLAGQADMYMEALQRRNAENRARVDECLADPTCTSVPIP